jgi:hypothetical protein
MKIDPQQIIDGLSLHGFQFSYRDDRWHEFVVVKKRGSELFERISIHQGRQSGGKIGDVVSAYVECAITPGRTALKGMAEVECLSEIANDPERGCAKLAGSLDARQWETKLIATAPARAAAFADSVGPQLLASTSDPRNAAAKYLARCRAAGSTPEGMLSHLGSQANDGQLRRSQRIASGSIIWNHEHLDFYEIAALAITLFFEEVEGDKYWLVGPDGETTKDPGLRFRMQLIAGQLIGEPGW